MPRKKFPFTPSSAPGYEVILAIDNMCSGFTDVYTQKGLNMPVLAVTV